jgi:hypothetical protein
VIVAKCNSKDLAQSANFQREARFRIDGKTVDEYNAAVDSSGLQSCQQE